MVTQLQPDVRAYLHGGEVIKRYIRVEEVAHEYGFSVEETEYIATISKKLIIEENDHAVKTRIPGTWGDEARYVWLRKENIMDIHNGKTMLTFLDSNKDYKLYDSQNRVVTTQKGTELYTHYDKVEASVRERYEKVQKQQKKTTQQKTVTTKKAR